MKPPAASKRDAVAFSHNESKSYTTSVESALLTLLGGVSATIALRFLSL